jgi:hypothetical protein
MAKSGKPQVMPKQAAPVMPKPAAPSTAATRPGQKSPTQAQMQAQAADPLSDICLLPDIARLPH